MSSSYQPGVCNIGTGEIRRRQMVAAIGALLTIVLAVILISGHHSKAMRASVFIPAMIFAVGWIQSRRKFCLAFGLMGTFNFGKLGELSKVADKDDLAKDRATAISILSQAIVLAIAITGLIVLIPIK
jgi:hypothetical protein